MTLSVPVEMRPRSGGVFAGMVVNATAEGLSVLNELRLPPAERVFLRIRARPGARDHVLQATVLRTVTVDAGIWNRLTVFRLLESGVDLMIELRDA